MFVSGCRKNKKDAVILIYNIDVDISVRTSIVTLANQLYWSSAIVHVLQLEITDSLTVHEKVLNEQMATETQIDRNSPNKYAIRLEDLVNDVRNKFTKTANFRNIIVIQDSMSESVIDSLKLAENGSFNSLYFVDFDESISKISEIINESGFTKIKIRKFGDRHVIDPFLFKEFCKGMDYSFYILF